MKYIDIEFTHFQFELRGAHGGKGSIIGARTKEEALRLARLALKDHPSMTMHELGFNVVKVKYPLPPTPKTM